jgi:hypothetical protein
MKAPTSFRSEASPVVSHVVVHDVRKEIEIVGDARADADAGRRVPPVLDISLLELPRRCAKNLRASLLRAPVDQRHDIL